jgi:5-(carboxyamino)imidazole ribonucleotide synthase
MVKVIKTIGILGGGQLGRMMAIAARTMGYNIVVLDPTPNCPCAAVADEQIVATYDDVDAAKELLNSCDVITYEFENVNLNVAKTLSAKLPQTSELLRITQNRIVEKQTINDAGLKTVAYKIITNKKELKVFIDDYELNIRNIVIKTAKGGYDGKGQYLIKNIEQLNDFVANKYNEDIEYVSEDFINFDKEVSIIVCRNTSGETACFPVAENIHKNQILHQSIVPARVSSVLEQKANAIAMQLAKHLNLVGTLAIEMFVCDDDIVINELAPRPHNSGHYTLNACATNQFEQHIRAICNLPLGNTTLFTPILMLNVLGQDAILMKPENVNKNKLHLYGKTEAKVDRKMGHINVLGNSVDECLKEVERLVNLNNN